MKVFVICCNDYEGSFFDSVWSTEVLALAEATRLNAALHGGGKEMPSYGYDEVEVDQPCEDITT